MQDKKSCVIYCRQATTQQNNNSINHQEITLKKIAKERGFKIKKIIKDIGTTTQIKKLIEWIRGKKVDYLLITGIDRICRNKSDFSQIFDLMERNKIKKIVTLDKDFDSKKDKASFLIFGAFCYLEKETLSRRIRIGHQIKQS